MRSSFQPNRSARAAGAGGFTLLEVLVSLAVVLIILAAVTGFVGRAEAISKTAGEDPYAGAAAAFETLAAGVAAATLEPYRDYADRTGAFRTAAGGTFVPDHAAGARISTLPVVPPICCWPGAGG